MIVCTKKIELQPLSPHWALLKIHWIAPVNASIEALTGKGAFHPDVCAVWRLNGARPDNFEQWELDLIREHYPTCPNYTTLLKLLPTRTWNGISKAANVQGVKTERGIKREVDMPLNACWQDIEVLPDYERGLAMIEEANKHCRKGGDRTLYGFWLLPTDTPKASPGTISEGETVTLTMGSLGQPDRTPYHR